MDAITSAERLWVSDLLDVHPGNAMVLNKLSIGSFSPALKNMKPAASSSVIFTRIRLRSEHILAARLA
jgi:hypothetical protein